MSKPEILSRKEVARLACERIWSGDEEDGMLDLVEALHNALVLSELARRGLEGVADHYLLSTSFDTREAVEEADAAVADLKTKGWVSYE